MSKKEIRRIVELSEAMADQFEYDHPWQRWDAVCKIFNDLMSSYRRF